MLEEYFCGGLRKGPVSRFDGISPRSIQLITHVFLIILLVFLAGCMTTFTKNDVPVAEKGVLDLKDWDFNKDGLLKLNGEWQFYWNQLLFPQDFNKSTLPEQTGYISLPRPWNGYFVDGKEISGKGFATFRLLVKTKVQQESLALKVLDMATAYRIWVNDKLVLSNGVVGKTYEKMEPQYYPKLTSIGTQSGDIILTIQVSNFHHKKGGVWEAITFGSESKIRDKREKSLSFEWFLIGSMLIMALYHFGLYALRRKDQSPLFFSLVCLLVAIRLSLVGERYLIHLYPNLNWELSQKMEYLTFYLGVPFFLMFMTSLFSEFSKRISYIYLWIGIAFSVFTLITPASIFTYGLLYNNITFAFLILYIFSVFPRILLNQRDGAVWNILGVIVLILSVIVDILSVNNLITTTNIAPFGMFFFIFFQSIMLSVRFSKTFTTLETLSSELILTNETKDKYVRALKDSEKKYRDLVENMDDVFFIVDLDGRFKYVSPAVIRVFGHNPDELYDTLTTDYIVAEDIKQGIESFSKTIAGEPKLIECRIYSKSKEIHWAQFNIRPMYESDKIIGAKGFVTDITELKRTHELMLQTEKMVSVGGLAAGMAHELNNPLAGVLLATQNVIRRLSADFKPNIEAAKEYNIDLGKLSAYLEKRQIPFYLTGIMKSGERAAEIIKNMLHFSRKSGSEKKPVMLSSLIDNTIELAKTDYDLKKDYDFRRIKIINDYDADLPNILCNKTEIEQVLFNLIKNAAQAMSEGDDTNEPQITCRLKRINQSIRIEIEDNGPGIKTNDQKRIFEPFFTTKPEGVGTGLGLSVSYMIITKNHQGTIEVESELGKGTRFIIQIPLES